ncbi:MAG: helix-turn-helix domain-containing protein [Pseudomonadota bacterium]
MAPKTAHERSCPLEETIKIFAGKWKPSIMHYLADEPCRFNELRRRMPAISQRMLTLQLRELEKDGLVIREHYPEIPPRVEYSVSPLGKTLKPIYLAIKEWDEKYTAAIQEARRNYTSR